MPEDTNHQDVPDVRGHGEGQVMKIESQHNGSVEIDIPEGLQVYVDDTLGKLYIDCFSTKSRNDVSQKILGFITALRKAAS